MTAMRDLVTPFAQTLRRLETEPAVLIPEARIRDTYRETRIGKSVREALARQLPTSVPREEVRFVRIPGHVMLVNPKNAAAL
jgi:hypothetical protein